MMTSRPRPKPRASRKLLTAVGGNGNFCSENDAPLTIKGLRNESCIKTDHVTKCKPSVSIVYYMCHLRTATILCRFDLQ